MIGTMDVRAGLVRLDTTLFALSHSHRTFNLSTATWSAARSATPGDVWI